MQVIAPAVLQPFDPDKQDVNDYIRRFETVASSQGWSENQKLAMLPILLSPVPSEWYREFIDGRKGRPPSRWKTLRHAISAAFTRRGGTDRAEAQLRKRRMQADESVDSYLYDVVRLCKLVDISMPEHRRIHFITRGLPPLMFSQILSRDFDTVDDLRSHLHKLEDSRHIFGDDSPYFEMMNKAATKNTELKDEIHKLKNVVKDLVQMNTIQLNAMGEFHVNDSKPYDDLSGHQPPPYRGAVNNDGQPICFNCNQTGHLSSTCQNEPFCFYCKMTGHLISNCSTKPPFNEDLY